MISEEDAIKLHLLASSSDSDLLLRKAIVNSASDSFISLLLSIVLNVVVGNLELSAEEHAALKPSATLLTQIASQTVELKAKRPLLCQPRSLRLLSQLLPFVLPQLIHRPWTWSSTSLDSSHHDSPQSTTTP